MLERSVARSAPGRRLAGSRQDCLSGRTFRSYGRGHNPRAAEFQFRRDVDYCSGALLFVRRSLFEELGAALVATMQPHTTMTLICACVFGLRATE